MATEEWSGGGGSQSLAQWVCWQTGCSPASARQLIALAEARATHPLLSAQLVAGELTVDQTAAAVKVRPECDAAMASLAPMSTVTQIRVEVRTANGVVVPPDADVEVDGAASSESPAGDSERLSQGWDDDDRWWLSATLDPERGAIVRAALEEAHDRLFRAGHGNVTWADALVDVASRALADLPEGRRDLYRVNMFLALDTPTVLTDGVVLPECVARHLTCDGALSPIFTEDSLPVAVGRSQRIVPERTRRVVLHRDGGCCRHCGSRVGIEIHHIVHWADGGATDPGNLVTLCGRCHRLRHRGRLGIVGSADLPGGVTFTDAHGRPFQRLKPNPPPDLPPPVRRYCRPLGEPLDRVALADVFPEPVWSDSALLDPERADPVVPDVRAAG